MNHFENFTNIITYKISFGAINFHTINTYSKFYGLNVLLIQCLVQLAEDGGIFSEFIVSC